MVDVRMENALKNVYLVNVKKVAFVIRVGKE